MNAGKTLFATDHGVCAVEQFCENRDTLWRRFRRAQFKMHRISPRHGLCATDLPRKSSRHRGLSAVQPIEVVQHGFSFSSQTRYAGRCQRGTRLAHLGRFGDDADQTCSQVVLQRQLWHRSCEYGLCAGQKTDPAIKGLRWTLLKGREKLSTTQSADLDALVAKITTNRTARAWLY